MFTELGDSSRLPFVGVLSAGHGSRPQRMTKTPQPIRRRYTISKAGDTVWNDHFSSAATVIWNQHAYIWFPLKPEEKNHVSKEM